MTTDTSTTTPAPAATAAARPGWWQGRSELLVAALVLAIAAFLGYQTATMAVPPGAESPGPRFFPTIVTVFMFGVGIALAVQVIRRPARPADGAAAPDDGADAAPAGEAAGTATDGADAPSAATAAAPASRVDWRTVSIVVGSLTAFILLLQPAGWILSAALLFFGVSYAMGSRRILFDITLSLVFSSIIQLAFVAGLGLPLPAGVFGGIF
ncbi:tripartite tricarboxylate transporter TctB family protein [Marinactinospora rubrisoli]|uniref:Tripartite tricarboxylate transporter TctB family protein n=1 Tax=Marinactinospora rubrisoli TaxID=2715399 RepID=A0ABW2KCM4_9ACTN